MTVNSVKVIQDSINTSGDRMITYEIETYRYIWAEVLTHKQLVKNAQSSRAVPVKSVLGINEIDPVTPIVWGKNQGGMSASEVLEGENLEKAKDIWNEAANAAFGYSKKLAELQLAKMWANRITEPFSRIKAVISGTEWENFEWLRDDPEAAQPEIVDLARKIKQAKSESEPLLLFAGEMHVPYVSRERDSYGTMLKYFVEQADGSKLYLTHEEAMKISTSCNGQVSYRKLDDSYEKALGIYERLFNGAKPHYSPAEHVAIAMQSTKAGIIDRLFPQFWETGVSHMDKNRNFWSAGLKGFIQYRKLLELGFYK